MAGDGRDEVEEAGGAAAAGRDDATRPDADDDPRAGRKGVSEGLRKALASGIRTVLSADDALRDGLPREAVGYMMRQTDAMKDEIVRITGQQIRRFLENLDVAGELQKILTSVSFEIRTEIRFVPNDQAVVAPRAKVRARTTRRKKKEDGSGEVEETVEELDGPALKKTRLGRAVDRALGAFQRELVSPDEEGAETPDAAPAGAVEDGKTTPG